jgi:hypothetical protein
MPRENVEKVYAALKKTEPQTPFDISKEVHLNQKTVQSILLDMAITNDTVKMKKIGRYRLFWKS